MFSRIRADITSWAIEFAKTGLEEHPLLVRGIVMSVNVLARFAALFILLFSWACARHKEKDDDGDLSEKTTKISYKFNTYFSLIAGQEDGYGWVMTEACDALLFSGLTSAIGRPVYVRAAQDGDGQWYRRPLDYPSCHTPGTLSSTISRDMLLGLFWHLWRRQDLAFAEELYEYGKDHNWIMGQGNLGRIYLTPALQATLAEIIFRLGGEDHTITRNLPQIWTTGQRDFELHLALLHVALRAELFGAISDGMIEVIKDAAGREPNNALAAVLFARYVSGNPEHTADLLLNEAWWPANRLPTNKDRKGPWLPERSYWSVDGSVNPDFLPVPEMIETKTHSGGDFLFVAKLYLEYVR